MSQTASSSRLAKLAKFCATADVSDQTILARAPPLRLEPRLFLTIMDSTAAFESCSISLSRHSHAVKTESIRTDLPKLDLGLDPLKRALGARPSGLVLNCPTSQYRINTVIEVEHTLRRTHPNQTSIACCSGLF